MDERSEALFSEVIGLLQVARCEIKALREILAERKIVSEEEVEERIEDVRKAEFSDLVEELKRRAFEKILKTRPTQ